ncbi:MAG: hypothetical protein ACP5JG_14900, partial [Anaerolineae bacterium]
VVDGEVTAAQRTGADVGRCTSTFQGFLHFTAPQVTRRTTLTVRLALIAEDGSLLHDTALDLEVFPTPEEIAKRACVVGGPDSEAARLADEMHLQTAPLQEIQPGDVILLSEVGPELNEVAARVAQGATALFVNLPPGQVEIAGDEITVEPCGMNARHFSSRATGHPLVADLKPDDVWFWYDAGAGYVTPLLATTFNAPGWTPILTSGNGDWSGEWGPALAAAEKPYGQGKLRICQVSLAGRTRHNPVARRLASRLLGAP